MLCYKFRFKRIQPISITFYCQLCNFQRPVKTDKPKVYDSTFVESRWYEWWKENNFFTEKADNERSKKDYMICLPPPNITGNLHIGHALTVAIEDTIARWRRMCGDNVIWVPGFDHAGIATQLVVERRLMNLKNISRDDLTRNQFVHECELWKDHKIAEITSQLEKLGASLNWNRCYYTMDENFSNAVYKAFQILYDQKLITWSRRLVNWSPYLKSTLSDIEIENKKIDEPQNLLLPGRTDPVPVGWMYFVDYELIDQGGKKITVATTRPETIPADVAIAVHPEDQRYGSLVGSFVKNPLVPSSQIKIISDHKVDQTIGTGALKITPGHDWNDYEIGLRHNLKSDINIFNEDGTCSSDIGVAEMKNLDRFIAREKVLEVLSSKGLLKEKRPHSTTIPVCGRSGDIIEPMLKDQWFLKIKPMAERVLQILDQKKVQIMPHFYEHQMRLWLNDARDWCISRQLLWGHRVPIFRVNFSDGFEFIVAKTENDAKHKISVKFPNKTVNLIKQETDVLDTWFSSSLIPLVVNGWPNRSNLPPSYPLALMETGNDIVTFWVTRMAMMCLHLSDEVPFKEILLHGIVRDAHGRKMSKSLGNVIDPMDVIEGKSLEDLNKRLDASDFSVDEKLLAKKGMKANFQNGIVKCGADGLRYSLLTNDIKNTSIKIFMSQIETHRNFCNKIWQGFNYIKPILNSAKYDSYCSKDDHDFSLLTNEDAWILSRLGFMVNQVNERLKNYEFSVSTQALFQFWCGEFCDIYIEWTKDAVWTNNVDRLKLIGRVFRTVIDVYVRSLAPIMPYVSEEINSDLPWTSRNASVHQRKFPLPEEVNFIQPQLDAQMQKVQSIVSAVRSLKQGFGLLQKTQVKASVKKFAKLLEKSTHLNLKMVHEDEFSLENFDATPFVSILINVNVQLFLELPNAERCAVVEKLEKQITKKKKMIEQLNSKAIFLAKISEKRQKPNDFDPTNRVQNLQEEIERLEDMIVRVKN